MSSDTSGVSGSDGLRTTQNLLGFLPQRSFGLKLLLVCALALLMAIPALFVFSVVYDRSSRANEATRLVSDRYGGMQTAMGPILIVPYTQNVIDKNGDRIRKDGQLTLYAETGTADAQLKTSIRKSGIHEIPIYEAAVSFAGEFDLARSRDFLPGEAEIRWEDAQFYLGFTNTRSALAPTEVVIGNQRAVVEPATAPDEPGVNRETFRVLSAPVSGLAGRSTPLPVTVQMSFTGAEGIAIAPFARNTEITISGDWDDPQFRGGFQQTSYVGGGKGEGFSALWNIPYEARGIPGVQDNSGFRTITASANRVEVGLVMNATPYQSVQRSLKYAIMFVGFVFLAYFLFEIVSHQRAHPAQYVLVGLGQSVFYLLLLALAEQAGFDIAFLVAAIMTIGLTSAYAMSVFRSRVFGYRALGVFSGVYALIYVLMRLEDYALLVGAFASFTAIGFTMYMTRNIDWYGADRQTAD